MVRSFRCVIAAFALFLVGGLTACQSEQSRMPESFILPEAYLGAFYIIHNAPNGKAGMEKDGVRTYEIPRSGVLVTQMNANEGWIESDKITFYYRQNDGELVEIKHRWTKSLEDNTENRADKKLTIFGGGLGEIQRTVNSCRITFRAFHVGTKSNILDGVNHFGIEEAIKDRHIECKQ